MEAEANFTPEPEHSPFLFDAIIVLGAGVQEKKSHLKSRIEPGFGGKMRAMAAAEAYRQGLTPVLVFSGGKTAGEEYPSEAQAMQAFLERKYQNQDGKFSHIPPEAIILEEKSKDTSTNFENLLKLIKEKGWNNVAILTNDFHLERTTKLIHNFSLEAEDISAEEKLKERDPRFIKIIHNFYSSSGMKSAQRTEKILMLMLKVDPKANIPRFIASHLRS